MPKITIDPVVHHYGAYPYPTRDPKDEAKRLILGSPSHIDEIIHYVFRGHLPQRQIRILVAGGGTGDGLTMLAQHCSDRSIDASITYLDLSSASRKIAEARIKNRHLKNVEFITGSLTETSRLAPGPYDYIDCCGVLHHLENPALGLMALSQVLHPSGGMGLMVYAPYGRSGVYPTQSALQRLAPFGEIAETKRVNLARRLAQTLPPSNLLRRNPLVRDHIDGGDAGIYDLLLHARDQAFTVNKLDRLVSGAGLKIISFIDPARYDPTHYLSDPTLRNRADGLDFIERAALAEELSSAIKNHVVYVSFATHRGAATLKVKAILMPRDGVNLTKTIRPNNILEVEFAGTFLRYALPRLVKPILTEVDGHKTLDDIFAIIKNTVDASLVRDVFDQQLAEIFKAYNAIGQLHIRFS